MKKGLRNTVMSLATLLALVSCGAPQVTEEVAKQRVQEISERRQQEDFKLPTKITITEKSKIDAIMNLEGMEMNVKENIDLKMVLDLDNYYYYMETITSAGAMKSWSYIEGNNLIIAQEDPSGKTYSEVPLEKPENYIDELSASIELVYELVLGDELLQITNLEEPLLDSLGITGTFDSDISYTSSAEGNLGIAIEANISDVSIDIEEGTAPIKISSSLDAKISFDNYLLSLL